MCSSDLFFKQRHVGSVGHAAEQQRVAIRRGTRHQLGADISAAAGAVFDNHLLADGLGEFCRYRARNEIDAAAGHVGRDDADRAGGIALRLCATGASKKTPDADTPNNM